MTRHEIFHLRKHNLSDCRGYHQNVAFQPTHFFIYLAEKTNNTKVRKVRKKWDRLVTCYKRHLFLPGLHNFPSYLLYSGAFRVTKVKGPSESFTITLLSFLVECLLLEVIWTGKIKLGSKLDQNSFPKITHFQGKIRFNLNCISLVWSANTWKYRVLLEDEGLYTYNWGSVFSV